MIELALDRDSLIILFELKDLVVQGEVDSPLYPLAMLRTAHCHWDAGHAEEAREYLQHVEDWIGDKTSPMWIRSLDEHVEQDLADFAE